MKKHLKMQKQPGMGTPKIYKIFVGGIHPDSSRENLLDFFLQYGEVVSIDIPVNKKTGALKGFCFVQFANRDDYEKSLQVKRPEVSGRFVSIKPALKMKDAEEEQENSQKRKLFVRNIPASADEVQIKTAFQIHYPVEKVMLVRNPKTGGSRGIGYVVMSTFEGYSALISLGRLIVDNQVVYLSKSMTKDQLVKRSTSYEGLKVETQEQSNSKNSEDHLSSNHNSPCKYADISLSTDIGCELDGETLTSFDQDSPNCPSVMREPSKDLGCIFDHLKQRNLYSRHNSVLLQYEIAFELNLKLGMYSELFGR